MGCTSDSGKSFICTALCRYFARQGIRVAPFKAQNMSNNAAITRDGLEIGRAQYVQALAALVSPEARMNPVLLKPTSDKHSQVIVMGRYDPKISKLPWLARKEYLWPIICDALHSLLRDYELVVIEGAGSPAEINLRNIDLVNMSIALESNADVYLVADIDRGGAFAHLLGTWMCLDAKERSLIKGFILNKFRGDHALLGNSMQYLEERTSVPTVAIVPMIQHLLPEEDSFHHYSRFQSSTINIALLLYPYASNLDEFDPLFHSPGINVVPIRDLCCLQNFHAVILPGSKNSVESLSYLVKSGLAEEVKKASGHSKLIFGICGGMQILGQSIFDEHGLEGGNSQGLGLLNIHTSLVSEKITRQIQTNWFNDKVLQGYEIHHGRTQAGVGTESFLPDGLGWRRENVYGVYLHGLFENSCFRSWFLKQLGWIGIAKDWRETIEEEFDRVAKLVTESALVHHRVSN